MSKHVVFSCDRCGREKESLDLPAKWGHVDGKDLCPACVEELREWWMEKRKSEGRAVAD
jgi:hypothetical protein